jgi:IPT/TIG domain
MAWTLHPAGSWGIATSSNPAVDMPPILALPGSWPMGQQPTCYVRKDQWGSLLAAPDVLSITPNTGLAAGGTGVSLVGDGLVGTTGVTFGGVAATGLIVNSDTLVTCITPAHADGAVDVVLSNPRGNVTKTGAFTYE